MVAISDQPVNSHGLASPVPAPPWNRIVERYAVTGEEWFCTLAMQPIHLAATLRAKHGASISDVFRRSRASRCKSLSPKSGSTVDRGSIQAKCAKASIYS